MVAQKTKKNKQSDNLLILVFWDKMTYNDVSKIKAKRNALEFEEIRI